MLRRGYAMSLRPQQCFVMYEICVCVCYACVYVSLTWSEAWWFAAWRSCMLEPVRTRLRGDAIVAPSLPFSHCLAFLSAKHFLLSLRFYGSEHAHTSIDWAMSLPFLWKHPKEAVPLFGMTGANVDAHIYPKIKHRLWTSTVWIQILIHCFVANVCQSNGHIAECWNPFSSTACRAWTHTHIHRHTLVVRDCSWTAAVILPSVTTQRLICCIETRSDAVWFLHFRHALAFQLKYRGDLFRLKCSYYWLFTTI